MRETAGAGKVAGISYLNYKNNKCYNLGTYYLEYGTKIKTMLNFLTPSTLANNYTHLNFKLDKLH